MLGIQWQEERFELATRIMWYYTHDHRKYLPQGKSYFCSLGVWRSGCWLSCQVRCFFFFLNCFLLLRISLSLMKWSPLIQELKRQFRMHLRQFSLAAFLYVGCVWLQIEIMCTKYTKALAKYALDHLRRHLEQSRCSGYNLWQQGFKKKS